jgi:subtilisin-like proprotein convertase family protein
MRTLFSIASSLLIFVLGGQTVLLAFVDKTPKAKTVNSKEPVETMLGESSIVPAMDFGFFNPTKNVTTTAPQLVGTDQGSESEPNNTFATADALTGTEGKIRGNSINGTSTYTPGTAGTDTDFYSFTTTVPNSKIYAATQTQASGGGTDTILAVIASDGTTVLETDDQDGSFSQSASSIAGTVLATPGTYYLRVTNFSSTALIAPYDLYFAVRSGATTPETEPNNNGTPQALPASQYVNGAIDPVGDTDTFTFTANAGDTVFISLDLDPERDTTTYNGRIGIGLFGTPNLFLVSSDGGTGDTIDSEAIFMTVRTTGVYQVYTDSQVVGGGGPTATYAFNVTTIPAANPGTCTTYTNNTPTAIADAALTTSTISIPDSKIIRSLRVVTDITHANYPDLDLHLRSPSNNDNGLFTDVGVNTQTGAQNTRLDDAAGMPQVFTAINGIIYQPETAYRLNWFKGENSLGTWALDIRDDTAANTGTLNSWSLEVCEEAPPAGTLIYNQNFEASNGGYTLTSPIGGAQAANEWEYGTPATPAVSIAGASVAPFNTCASGVNCWKTDLDNTYDVSSSQDLTSPNLNLTQFQGNIRLYWQQRYNMESVSFDHIFVRVTEVGNPTNTRVVWNADNATMSDGVGTPVVNIGESAGWGRYNADISDFAGKNIQVTFHLTSDTTVNLGGWAIDDVQIYQLGPVAANVGVGGRVVDSKGNAISRANVTLTGANGIPRTVRTNTFGYYRFDNVEVGDSYILEATAKGYTFAPRVVTVQDEVTDADMVAIE